jgi:hypothetical protein
MNPFMNLQSGERVLREERVHPSIFVLPVLGAIASLIPFLIIFSLVTMLTNMLRQVSPGSVPSGLWLVWLLPLLLLILLQLGILLGTFISYSKTRVTLTNRRMAYNTGFLFRVSGELPLENVEAIIMVEPILGRLLGYGTVIVSSLGGLRFPLRFIAKPQIFHATLQIALTDAKTGNRPSPRPPTPPPDDSRYMPRR